MQFGEKQEAAALVTSVKRKHKENMITRNKRICDYQSMDIRMKSKKQKDGVKFEL